MGRGKRFQPTKLAEKLTEIRNRLEMNQSQLFKHLGETKSTIYASYISGYEMGTREPPLDVLLRYARIAGVPVDVLIDDELELPKVLPSEKKYEWILTMRERNS